MIIQLQPPLQTWSVQEDQLQVPLFLQVSESKLFWECSNVSQEVVGIDDDDDDGDPST